MTIAALFGAWQVWGMKMTFSLDLRERILSAYVAYEGTREDEARWFRVPLGMVKKLL